MRKAIKTRIKARHTFSTSGLYVVASLRGATHRFPFRGRAVEVRLPSEWGRTEDLGLELVGWRLRGKQEIPRTFLVNWAEFLIDIPREYSVPAGSPGRVRFSEFTKKQRERFEVLAERDDVVLRAALDYWLRVLGWKSPHRGLGQPEVIHHRMNRATYLVDAKHEKPFFSASLKLTGSSNSGVSKGQWNAAQQSLARNEEPPAWVAFMLDGYNRLSNDDVAGALMSLAVAAETLLRRLFARFVKDPDNDELLKLLGWIPIFAIRNAWKKKLGHSTPRWEQNFDAKTLEKLFAARNDLMHRGVVDIDSNRCREFATAVHTFVLFGDSLL